MVEWYTRWISYSCRRNQLCNQGNEASLVHQQNHLHSKNVFVELNAKIDNTLSGLVWFYCFQTFKFFGFSIFWWWLFQKRVVRTKFDIHVFVRSHWHDNHTKHCFPTLSIIPFSYGKGPLDTIVLPTRHIVCERLLSNAKSAIFQIYYGENKLIFNEMMRSTNTLY